MHIISNNTTLYEYIEKESYQFKPWNTLTNTPLLYAEQHLSHNQRHFRWRNLSDFQFPCKGKHLMSLFSLLLSVCQYLLSAIPYYYYHPLSAFKCVLASVLSTFITVLVRLLKLSNVVCGPTDQLTRDVQPSECSANNVCKF